LLKTRKNGKIVVCSVGITYAGNI